MTAKDRAKMRRLELENEQLRAANARHLEVYRDQAIELIELRAAVETVRELLASGKEEL